MSTRVEVRTQMADMSLNCPTLSEDMSLAFAGSIGMLLGNSEISNSHAEITFNNQAESGMNIAAVGGLVGAQLAANGELNISGSSTTGNINNPNTNSSMGFSLSGGLVGASTAGDIMISDSLSDVDINVENSMLASSGGLD